MEKFVKKIFDTILRSKALYIFLIIAMHISLGTEEFRTRKFGDSYEGDLAFQYAVMLRMAGDTHFARDYVHGDNTDLRFYSPVYIRTLQALRYFSQDLNVFVIYNSLQHALLALCAFVLLCAAGLLPPLAFALHFPMLIFMSGASFVSAVGSYFYDFTNWNLTTAFSPHASYLGLAIYFLVVAVLCFQRPSIKNGLLAAVLLGFGTNAYGGGALGVLLAVAPLLAIHLFHRDFTTAQRLQYAFGFGFVFAVLSFSLWYPLTRGFFSDPLTEAEIALLRRFLTIRHDDVFPLPIIRVIEGKVLHGAVLHHIGLVLTFGLGIFAFIRRSVFASLLTLALVAFYFTQFDARYLLLALGLASGFALVLHVQDLRLDPRPLTLLAVHAVSLLFVVTGLQILTDIYAAVKPAAPFITCIGQRIAQYSYYILFAGFAYVLAELNGARGVYRVGAWGIACFLIVANTWRTEEPLPELSQLQREWNQKSKETSLYSAMQNGMPGIGRAWGVNIPPEETARLIEFGKKTPEDSVFLLPAVNHEIDNRFKYLAQRSLFTNFDEMIYIYYIDKKRLARDLQDYVDLETLYGRKDLPGVLSFAKKKGIDYVVFPESSEHTVEPAWKGSGYIAVAVSSKTTQSAQVN